jgi:glycosylphosphatidylinositol transamidase (GPIT) subunit GPI8
LHDQKVVLVNKSRSLFNLRHTVDRLLADYSSSKQTMREENKR